MSTPEDIHTADLARDLTLFEEVFVRPVLEICWCGVEITPDMPEHTLCHPGME